MPRKSKDPFLKQKKLVPRQVIGAGIVALALGLAFYGRGKSEVQLLKINGEAFSTFYKVKVVSREFPEGTVEKLKEVVDKEVEFVDKEMSRFREDSAIARFNASNSTEPFIVSSEMAMLLSRSRQVSEMTGGAFDVTVGPLVRLWGFYTKNRSRVQEPSPEEIAKVRSMVGYSGLEIDLGGPSIKKNSPELHVDLSAIAKGFAVDRIGLALEAVGVKNYMVEIGGEVRAKGVNQQGRAWRIGIEKPVFETRELFQIVELKDKSIATSGDYRNYYEFSGKMVSHTLDPRTGSPLNHQLASVSVVHDECALADALATAFTVLGPKDGYDLAEARGIPVLFMTRQKDGTLKAKATSEFDKFTVSRVNNGPQQGLWSMITILISIVIFIAAVFLLSVGIIFSKSTRLKKSCSGGLGPQRADENGNELSCGTCYCKPDSEVE